MVLGAYVVLVCPFNNVCNTIVFRVLVFQIVEPAPCTTAVFEINIGLRTR